MKLSPFTPALFALLLTASALAYAHDGVPEVTFVASKTAQTGPFTVAAGYVNLSLDNQDTVMRAHGIFRVKKGADVAAAKALVMRAFRGEEIPPEEEKALTDGFYGGAVFVPPGSVGKVGVTLEPGIYIVYADQITDEDVAITPEYISTLRVTPNSNRAERPTPDYTIKLVDHAFGFPNDLEAGAHLYRVENLGQQEHMMFISKLLPGKTSADVMALLEDETLEVASVLEAKTSGVHGIGAGTFNDVVLDFMPGQYAAICWAVDPKTGTPHAMLGMTSVFTVHEKQAFYKPTRPR